MLDKDLLMVEMLNATRSYALNPYIREIIQSVAHFSKEQLSELARVHIENKALNEWFHFLIAGENAKTAWKLTQHYDANPWPEF
ncbi:MAG: hypothetical protein ACOYJ1_05755 [Peptococcales bacterium]